jgi:predicted dehydrogenase
MSEVRVGVIGVGSLGQHHARIYSEIEGASLVGVADVDKDRANAVASKLGCRAFFNYRELLAEVEAVSLAVPTERHAEIGTEVLRNRTHVLIEKPIASDLAEADQLLELSERNQTILQVGHTERFNPVVESIRSYVTKPQFFEAHRLGVFVPRSLDIDVVLDLMIHDLDLVLSLTRQPIKEIHAVGIPVLTPRVDIANVRIEFQDGCVANLTASRVSKERVRKLRFFQPHDYISLDLQQKSIEMFSLVEAEGERRIIERKPPIEDREPLKFELEAFVRAARGNPSSISCSGEEGRRSLEAALQVVQKIQLRQGD